MAHDKEAGKGYWLLTRRGSQFLLGQETIPAKVQVMNNRIIGHDELHVSVEDVLGSRPYFEDIETIERERVPLETAQGSLFDEPAEEPAQRRAGDFFGGAAA